ncbi:MAG: LptF/LptG family permease, partial [Sphaerochaetaceae bacterium]
HDLLIIDNSDPSRSTTITSKQGTLSLVDINAYVYRLDLEDATLAETSAKLNRQYSLSSARSMTLYLDFSASVSSSASTTPSQMSLRQIKAAMDENEKAYESQRSATLSQGISSYKEYLRLMEECRQGETIDYNLAYNLFTSYQAIAKSIQQGFTSKYYESEYNKKLALSMACTFLIFMAFPLSFIKIRYGRLLGFGLSIFSCAAYWFMLFYAQVLCLRVNISPAFLIWAPNAFFLLVGTILLIRLARS